MTECPLCHQQSVEGGYGLAGGGLGFYESCTREECEYFYKVQDGGEGITEPPNMPDPDEP